MRGACIFDPAANSNCDRLASHQHPAMAAENAIDDIILVQKTHLDVGFTDLPSTVINTYLEHFIPAALDMAQQTAEAADPNAPRFVWTTGSWLIWTALEAADSAGRARLEAAITNGWLRWHALPVTFHTELLDANNLRAGLAMSAELDRRFGVTTQAAKMTDVPGHTIGMVPLLAEAGVKLLHLGVNPASKLPQVPTAFRWRHPDGSEISVIYDSGYGGVAPLAGSSSALAFLFTNDNLGPPAPAVLAAEFEALAATYPGATVRAGTMEDAVAQLDASQLPVFEQEIGDSWLHGIGSAPQRVADYRAIARGLATDPSAHAPAQAAMLVPEHTWGLDSKSWLPDRRPLSPAEFAHERRRAAWQPLTQAYAEQDAFLDQAVAKTEGALRDTVTSELAASQAVRTLRQPGANAEVFDRWSAMVTPRWIVRIDPANGVLMQLLDRQRQVDLAGPGGRLGILNYRVLGTDRFTKWVDEYLLRDELMWWAAEDFGRIDTEGRFPNDLDIPYRADQLWLEREATGTALLLHLMPRHVRVAETGAPRAVSVRWWLPDDPAAEIEIEIGWDDKPATLAPETMWLGWRPQPTPSRVLVDKFGSQIDVASVVDDGGLLHAVNQVTLEGAVPVQLTPLDGALVCPDGPRLLERRLGPPDLTRGTWFNLFNTGWSTNFGFWTEGAMGYRLRAGLVD